MRQHYLLTKWQRGSRGNLPFCPLLLRSGDWRLTKRINLGGQRGKFKFDSGNQGGGGQAQKGEVISLFSERSKAEYTAPDHPHLALPDRPLFLALPSFPPCYKPSNANTKCPRVNKICSCSCSFDSSSSMNTTAATIRTTEKLLLVHNL